VGIGAILVIIGIIVIIVDGLWLGLILILLGLLFGGFRRGRWYSGPGPQARDSRLNARLPRNDAVDRPAHATGDRSRFSDRRLAP